MTRDMEVIRKIILEIQSRKDAEYHSVEIPNYDGVTVARHLELMMHAGLIEGQKSFGLGMPSPLVIVKDLTWEGHDLASALTNDNVWAQIKKKLSPAELATIPLSVIKDIGVALVGQLVKGQLGLS